MANTLGLNVACGLANHALGNTSGNSSRNACLRGDKRWQNQTRPCGDALLAALHDYTFGMKSVRQFPAVRLAVVALGALLTLSLSHPAFAQWKWKDKSGQVQYSDLPPPQSVSEADILQRPSGSARKAAPAFAPGSAQAAAAAMAASAAASSAAGGPAKAVEPELEAKRRKAAEEEATKRRAEEEKQKAARADNCLRAKAQLRALDDGMRMARVNAKGEREILDDKARAEESKRARDIVSSDCK